MNNSTKKPILLLFLIVSLTSDTALSKENQPMNTSYRPGYKKKQKKKKAHKTYKKQKNKFRKKAKSKFGKGTKVYSFNQLTKIAPILIAQQEKIESARGIKKEERLNQGLMYLATLNKEIETADGNITVGQHHVPTQLDEKTVKSTIMPSLTLLVELAALRSLIHLSEKVKPAVFAAAQATKEAIQANVAEFNTIIQDTNTYAKLDQIDSKELNKIILCLLAIYNTEINKKEEISEKKGYFEKIKQYFGSELAIIKEIDKGLEKAAKAFDLFFEAADDQLDKKIIKGEMINEIMYAIGVEGKSIFEKAGSPFINDMITAISIKPTTKTGEVDAQATKKQTIFKHYADGYKKLVGVSSYPIRTIKAFYARAKQFVTAAENRGLLKTAGALVAATVIGGVAAKDIYDAKKLMADTDGTWKDAVKMGIRHTAGRPGRFAESAWENSKELGRKAKSTWDNRRSIAKNAWEKTKELAEKPGQKYREWQWNKALAAQDEADFNNRNRMNPEENYQNKEYGRKPSMKEKAKALYSKWRKKGKNNQQLEKDLEQENFNMMQENIQRGNEIRDRQEEITEKTLAKAINSLPNFRGYNDDEE